MARNHLRFFGPTTVSDVAAYLDSPKREVTEHWPADVEEVTVEKAPRFVLAGDVDAVKEVPKPAGIVRLLGTVRSVPPAARPSAPGP